MAPPFYQPAIDALKNPSHDPALKLLIELMEAIDKANTAKLPVAAAKLRSMHESNSHLQLVARPPCSSRRCAASCSCRGPRNSGSSLTGMPAATTSTRRSARTLWTELLATVPLPSTRALKDNQIDKEFDRTRDALAVILASHADARSRSRCQCLSAAWARLDAIEVALVKLCTALMFLFERALDLALIEFGKGGKDRGKALLELNARWSQIRRGDGRQAAARQVATASASGGEPDENEGRRQQAASTSTPFLRRGAHLRVCCL